MIGPKFYHMSRKWNRMTKTWMSFENNEKWEHGRQFSTLGAVSIPLPYYCDQIRSLIISILTQKCVLFFRRRRKKLARLLGFGCKIWRSHHWIFSSRFQKCDFLCGLLFNFGFNIPGLHTYHFNHLGNKWNKGQGSFIGLTGGPFYLAWWYITYRKVSLYFTTFLKFITTRLAN